MKYVNPFYEFESLNQIPPKSPFTKCQSRLKIKVIEIKKTTYGCMKSKEPHLLLGRGEMAEAAKH